ncbi:hypothetical protein [Altericroceibacterium endophyticum]|uniref:hypothetical protein n=1 Tax=Altericroceibacterium endophyticum TaxID=1808508 RepID=UPI001926A381|nr:hypothetical protein [Altericroceibacterium endophyticum]
MFDRRFFASKLGQAALVSVAAMVSFNIFALSQQVGMTPNMLVASVPMATLA